ncbi:MAG: HD-GYP domain-containing protein [Phycisphaerae bacterium]|nr:HD-GYP domain-containing protein [Phycisphaerae bacterium]
MTRTNGKPTNCEHKRQRGILATRIPDAQWPGNIPVWLRPGGGGICPACLWQVQDDTARQLRLTHLQTARTLAAAVEAKDPYTRDHSVTVSKYAVELGIRLKLPEAKLRSLRIAALLHDIGKIGIPDAVLQKPGPLTRAEFSLIKTHPRLATTILRHAGLFEDELPIILYHHEWFDGGGYPTGLAGESIPLGSRILGVADAIDALRSRRIYKKSAHLQKVRRELLDCSGRQFDPRVARAAVCWLDDQPKRYAWDDSLAFSVRSAGVPQS